MEFQLEFEGCNSLIAGLEQGPAHVSLPLCRSSTFFLKLCITAAHLAVAERRLKSDAAVYSDLVRIEYGRRKWR